MSAILIWGAAALAGVVTAVLGGVLIERGLREAGKAFSGWRTARAERTAAKAAQSTNEEV